jgi:hypothetical protein
MATDGKEGTRKPRCAGGGQGPSPEKQRQHFYLPICQIRVGKQLAPRHTADASPLGMLVRALLVRLGGCEGRPNLSMRNTLEPGSRGWESLGRKKKTNEGGSQQSPDRSVQPVTKYRCEGRGRPRESGPELMCTLEMGTVTSQIPGDRGTQGDMAKPFVPPG